MEITIKQGKHYCSGYSLGSVHINKESMGYDVSIDENGLYLHNNPDCDGDLNKLFGFSYGYHHTNSFRLSFKAVNASIEEGTGQLKGSEYMIAAYFYINGVRGIKYLRTIKANEVVRMSIIRIAESIIFTVGDKSFSVAYSGPYGLGYNLRPYYGGNCTTPRTMKIKLTDYQATFTGVLSKIQSKLSAPTPKFYSALGKTLMWAATAIGGYQIFDDEKTLGLVTLGIGFLANFLLNLTTNESE